ncbi:hypothetical protein Phum_PHUM114430 [Pediculus humanus corporis]|uniref:Uncharacterized protein n=1 Tax=Pediculus humanus subsp. corporis TaxID=121224 RepID=E0VDF1_PEDHC|nr:uncharacterized protein Phum_PHUM114430 [Pediculus humanus corporis]EEB11407.1 hypothetical protein Phum_PHUM114430 [Pediculus humanus corporis]
MGNLVNRALGSGNKSKISATPSELVLLAVHNLQGESSTFNDITRFIAKMLGKDPADIEDNIRSALIRSIAHELITVSDGQYTLDVQKTDNVKSNNLNSIQSKFNNLRKFPIKKKKVKKPKNKKIVKESKITFNKAACKRKRNKSKSYFD